MLGIYAILDVVAQAFMNPFYFRNNAEAHRAFGEAIKGDRPDSQLAKFPTDHVLYRLGTFDPTTGHITSLDLPELIARGTDFTNIPSTAAFVEKN